MSFDLRNIYLHRGAHAVDDAMFCAMELAAFMAKERHTDSPQCVCPLLTNLVIELNDSMENNDRQQLKDFIPRLINTRDPVLQKKRRALAYWHLMSSIMPFALQHRLSRPDALAKDVASRIRTLGLYRLELLNIDPENPLAIQDLFYRPLQNDLSMSYVVEEAFYDYFANVLEYNYEDLDTTLEAAISTYSRDIMSDLQNATSPEDADTVATALDDFWKLALSALDKLILDEARLAP